MAVRLLVGLRCKDGHMRGQFGIWELHEHAFTAGTPSFVGVQLIPCAHVRKEIAVPKTAQAEALVEVLCLDEFGFGVKVPLSDGSGRLKGIVEIQLGIRQCGHGHRHITVMKQPYRLVTLHIAENMLMVARHQKHRMLLPLKALLGFVFGPHSREAATRTYVDDFIQGELDRRR